MKIRLCVPNLWLSPTHILTPSEKHYAVIEKETLAVAFAMERFHQYIYGRHVTASTVKALGVYNFNSLKSK